MNFQTWVTDLKPANPGQQPLRSCYHRWWFGDLYEMSEWSQSPTQCRALQIPYWWLQNTGWTDRGKCSLQNTQDQILGASANRPRSIDLIITPSDKSRVTDPSGVTPVYTSRTSDSYYFAILPIQYSVTGANILCTKDQPKFTPHNRFHIHSGSP